MQPFQACLTNPKHIARFYAKLAVRALYQELALYPKPGLVSFVDTGAHSDMDGLLFLRSLFSLRHYFFQISLHAALGENPFQLVRRGLAAEERMYQRTKGVNTHRGALFALGILCTSLSRLSLQKTVFTLDELQENIQDFWSIYLKTSHQNTKTHGRLVKEKYGFSDAKALAITGYALIFEIYESLAKYQDDPLFFGLLAYQSLLLQIDDINILYRVGPQGLDFARQTILTGISPADREGSIQSAVKIHQLFSKKNISPGGVADMLSLLYFLVPLFRSDTQKTKPLRLHSLISSFHFGVEK